MIQIEKMNKIYKNGKMELQALFDVDLKVNPSYRFYKFYSF